MADGFAQVRRRRAELGREYGSAAWSSVAEREREQRAQIQFSTRASDGFLAIDFPFSLRHHATRASLRGSLAKFLSFTSSPRELQSNTEYSILVKAAGIVDVGFCLTFFCHNLLSKYLCTTYEPKFCYRTTYKHNDFVTHVMHIIYCFFMHNL